MPTVAGDAPLSIQQRPLEVAWQLQLHALFHSPAQQTSDSVNGLYSDQPYYCCLVQRVRGSADQSWQLNG